LIPAESRFSEARRTCHQVTIISAVLATAAAAAAAVLAGVVHLFGGPVASMVSSAAEKTGTFLGGMGRFLR
jgi:hypothetical protein